MGQPTNPTNQPEMSKQMKYPKTTIIGGAFAGSIVLASIFSATAPEEEATPTPEPTPEATTTEPEPEATTVDPDPILSPATTEPGCAEGEVRFGVSSGRWICTDGEWAEAPAPEPAYPPAPPTTEAGFTPSQEQAIRSAKSYLDFVAFSAPGLIGQLEYEGFTTEDATVAVDFLSLAVDWNEQAAAKAESYLDFTAFSCSGLIDQLEFEEFTTEQATYGATSTGICG